MANKKIATIITVVLVTIMISMALISNARPVEISASSTTDINLNVKVAIYSGGWAGGATVTLTYPDGKTYTGTTNKGGECHFSNVPPGNCTVTATLNGATAGLPVSLKTGNNDITITLPETWVSASFTTDVTSGDYPLTVVFTDTSTGYPVPSSWDWDFGDGSAHVYMKDASHTYASAGTYTATLTVGNSAGDSDSATTTITVTTPVVPPETWVVASFTPDVTSGDYPLAVVFTDASTGSPVPSSWHWDFGDGVSSDGKASSHTYTTAGTYTVTLTTKRIYTFLAALRRVMGEMY
jgi:PKD repeat protein